MEAIRSLNREHRDAIIVLSKTSLRLTNKNDPMWRLIPLAGLSFGIQLTRDEKEKGERERKKERESKREKSIQEILNILTLVSTRLMKIKIMEEEQQPYEKCRRRLLY